MSELKAIAAYHGTAPTGDKRSKQSWIDAIELFQANAVIEVAAYHATESNHTEGLTEASQEIDDEATWELVEYPSHAEQEAIAHAVDTADSPAKSSKSGAVLVVSAIACLLLLVCGFAIFAFKAMAKLGSYVVRLFGQYDPDLDLAYLFKRFRRDRQPADSSQRLDVVY